MTPFQRLRKAFAESFRPSARYVPSTPEEVAAYKRMTPEQPERLDELAQLKAGKKH